MNPGVKPDATIFNLKQITNRPGINVNPVPHLCIKNYISDRKTQRGADRGGHWRAGTSLSWN